VAREVGVDADRERPDAGGAVAAGDAEPLAADARLDRAVHRLQEVVAVVLRVEPEQVVAEHAVEQLAGPRADAERLRVRPGDVPELRHHQVRPGALQQPRQEGEVVVLHEYERRAASRFLEDGRGEEVVHLLVRCPVGGVERRAVVDLVAERPQAAVGEPVVVAVLLLRREPDAAEGVGRVVRRHADPAAGVGREPVGAAGAVRHPRPAAGPHHRVEGGGQPAGGAHQLDRPVAEVVDVRLAVGDDDQLRPAEAGAGRVLEAVLGPGHAASGVRERERAVLGGGPGIPVAVTH
jgi:hypothetical protein